jgi:hypothetical protein
MTTTLLHDDAPATTTLDVRPLLAAGEEPFSLIMSTAEAHGPGATLDLIAPFEPVPLYAKLGPKGWAHRVRAVDVDGATTVRFTATGVTADRTPVELLASHPAVQPVLDAHGIDQCCGGHKPLATIAVAHGLDLPALLDALQQAALRG